MIINDTISAISTAHGVASGIAVIRISGENALSIAKKMFKPASKNNECEFESYKMYPGYIDAGDYYDFGLCVYFKAPKSFTGEDVVEFHCHGGLAVSEGVLEKTFELGSRPATKGEFTKRAFLYGKLSLSSCEGLIGMINAESNAEAKAGSYLYRERLFKKIKEYQAELKNILASIEVEMDYPDEVENDSSVIFNRLSILDKNLERLESTYSSASKAKNGIKVAIVGKPNAGKSSVLNALLGCDKAIVSDIEGTTRDIVEGDITINGVKFNFFDTAGIRESENAIEKIGIERAFSVLNSADLVLHIIDAENPIEDNKIAENINQFNVLKIVNKTDLAKNDIPCDIFVSAKTNENIDKLKELVYNRVGLDKIDLNGDFLTEKRHFNAICDAHNYIKDALVGIECMPLDAITIDLETAFATLGLITGETASEAVIEEIFSKFCVGK